MGEVEPMNLLEELKAVTSSELRGVQMGLCNLAQSGVGVQLGLVNGFGSGDDRLWLPVVNARF